MSNTNWSDPEVRAWLRAIVWARKCQECGERMTTKRPNPDKELTDAYRNQKCRKCGSSGLDYGSEEHIKGL